MALGRLVCWRSMGDSEAIDHCRDPAAGAHPLRKLVWDPSAVEVWTESDSCGRSKGGCLLLKLDRRSVVVGAQSNDLADGSCPMVEAHLGSDYEEARLKSTCNGSSEEICLR